MTEIRKYQFPAQYIPFTDDTAFGNRLHEFQVIVRDIMSINQDCLFLNAPTAAGKTFAFILPTAKNKLTIRRPKTLIITPTNLLIAQTAKDIREIINKNSELNDIKVEELNRSSLRSLKLPSRATEIKNKFTMGDIIISNPDIISLFLTGFYYEGRLGYKERKFTRNRTTADVLSQLDVIIFDEYHVYSEEELGKIVALIGLTKLNNNIPKLIFTSATPHQKIRILLEEIGLKCLEYSVNATDIYGSNSRKIRGVIELIITDEPIMDSLKETLKSTDKILFLFDHKIDAEIARSKLLNMGIESNQIEDKSGFSNRATTKHEISGLERYIIATNAAEQGLNLDVSVSHIEPGLYVENLTQRYGRIGRKGKEGSITIHFEKQNHIVEKISNHINDFSDLISDLETILFNKHIYMSKIKRHFAAFLGLCTIRDYRGIFGKQISEFIQNLGDQTISEVYFNMLKFNESVDFVKNNKIVDPRDIDSLTKWWNKFLLSIGFFRGESMSVKVQLKRDDGIVETTEDLVWLKKWCVYEKFGNDKEQFYLIETFKEIPSSIELTYNLPQTTLTIGEKELWNRQIFSEKYYNYVAGFIDDALVDIGLDVNRMKTYFKKVAEIIHPNMLMPQEVELVSNSQII